MRTQSGLTVRNQQMEKRKISLTARVGEPGADRSQFDTEIMDRQNVP